MTEADQQLLAELLHIKAHATQALAYYYDAAYDLAGVTERHNLNQIEAELGALLSRVEAAINAFELVRSETGKS